MLFMAGHQTRGHQGRVLGVKEWWEKGSEKGLYRAIGQKWPRDFNLAEGEEHAQISPEVYGGRWWWEAVKDMGFAQKHHSLLLEAS